MILCNGIPKSGTHCLLKAYDLNRPKVGSENADTGHFPFGTIDTVENKHILIIRHPRNCIVSMVRMGQKSLTEENVIACINEFNGKPFAEYADDFLGFLTDGSTHVIRYEDLVSDISAIQGMCAFVGIPYVEGTFEILPTSWTFTNNKTKTHWEEYWTPAIDEVWAMTGLRIEKILKY